MPAFIDVQCEKCGRRFGWYGEMTDRPPCPACGHRPPQEDLEDQARRFRAMMDAAAEADFNPFRLARKACELTLRAAARLLGMTPTALSAVEQGRTKPPPDLVRRAAALYEVPEQDLRGGRSDA